MELISSKRQEIMHTLASLEKEEQQIHSALSTRKWPEGTIRFQKNGGSYKWYQVMGRERIYLPKKSRETASLLARKTAMLARLHAIQREKDACLAFLKKFEAAPTRLEHVSESPEFLKLTGQSLPESARKWALADYTRNTNHPEALRFKTSSGRCVRSKSEAMIAMSLEKFGIPYRYECALEIESGTIYPDFTIRRPVDDKICLWEHFGMMDRSGYAANALEKIPHYMRLGFFPDDNLLLTFETAEHPLDTFVIERMIRQMLLDE